MAAFRKAQKRHSEDGKALADSQFKFEYLYIDSNTDILDSDQWTIYGEDVSLNNSDIINLKAGLSNTSYEKIASEENIKDWIGDLTNQYAKRAGIDSEDAAQIEQKLFSLGGAGQMRRYGRVLFALNAKIIHDTLVKKLTTLTQNRVPEVCIRIFCTLGGGTGSGSVVDMVTLLKSIAKKHLHDYRIYLYPFIAGPKVEIKDKGSFFENQYAALRDLNGLMVGTYSPYVTGTTEGGTFDVEGTPIRSICICTDTAPGEPDLPTQIEHLTNACYDSILYFNSYSDPDGLKPFTWEDYEGSIIAEPEGNPLRSYRFTAHGSKRWLVPTEQICSLLKAEHIQRMMDAYIQGSLQERGKRKYADFPTTSISVEGRETTKFLERQCENIIAPFNVTEKVIAESKNFDDSVLDSITHQAKAACRSIDALNDEDVQSEFARNYEKDAEYAYKQLSEEAASLLKWTAGRDTAWGLQDIIKGLDSFTERTAKWADSYSKKLKSEDFENKKNEILENMKRRTVEWKKLGVLTKILTPFIATNMIKDQNDDAITLINLHLSSFRHNTINKLSKEINEKAEHLSSTVGAAKQEAEEIRSAAATQVSTLWKDLCPADSESEESGDLYEFDAKNLEKLRKYIKEDDKTFHTLMVSFSKIWESEEIGSIADYEDGSMDKYLKNVDAKIDAAYRELERAACSAHKNDVKDMLIGSIMDRLKQIGGNDEKAWDKSPLIQRIKSFAHNFRTTSDIFPSGGLKNPQTPPLKAIYFGFPKAGNATNKDLCNWIKKTLPKHLPADMTAAATIDFFEHESSGEIRVLYVPFWFPARFSSVVKFIYEKYKKTEQTPSKSATIFFANLDNEDYSLNSALRPAVTDDGDRDLVTAERVDFAMELGITVRISATGTDMTHLVAEENAEHNIHFLKNINPDGTPTYSNWYVASMKTQPSKEFKRSLDDALKLAKERMTDEEKDTIIHKKTLEWTTAQQIYGGTDKRTLKALAQLTLTKKELGKA